MTLIYSLSCSLFSLCHSYQHDPECLLDKDFLLTSFLCWSFFFSGASTCSWSDSKVFVLLFSLKTTFLTVLHLSLAVGRVPVCSKTLSEIFAVNVKPGTEGSAARVFIGYCTLPHLENRKYDQSHYYWNIILFT